MELRQVAFGIVAMTAVVWNVSLFAATVAQQDAEDEDKAQARTKTPAKPKVLTPGKPSAPPVPGKPSAPPMPGKPSAPPIPGKPSAPPILGKPSAPPIPGKPSAPPIPGKPSTPPMPGKPSAPPMPGKPSAPSKAPSPRFKLQVLSPNGGESLRVGTTVKVRWRARGASGRGDVLLQKSGRTVAKIARGINLAAGSVSWKVTGRDLSGGGYSIVVRSSDGRTKDQSDRPFSILPATRSSPARPGGTPTSGSGTAPAGGEESAPTSGGGGQPAAPTITITTPAANETWCTNAPHEFRWAATLPAGVNVKIDLMNSTGQSVWRAVAASTLNDGSYEWPGMTDAQFPSGMISLRPRISATDGSVSKTGNYVHFGKRLLLSKPSSNLTWRQGSHYTIQWMQLCDLPSPLNIELLNSSHQPVSTIASGLTTAGSVGGRSHGWTVPADLAPGTYYIRVHTSDGQLSSEKSFTVAPPLNVPVSAAITITAPTPNSTWCTDEAHAFNWSSTLPPSTNVKIDLMNSTGSSVWRSITPSTANTGSFVWPGLSDAQFVSGMISLRPRISTLDNSVLTVGEYVHFGKRLLLSKPSSNLTWRQGSHYTIQWMQLCDLSSTITIELLDSAHQLVSTIASGLSTSGSVGGKSYGWTVPANLAPGVYYIRVRTADSQLSRETSFNVAPPLQF